MSELNVDPVAQFCADWRSVRFSASMNSRLMTEYAAGVSRKSVASRPPASALVAAKPVSRSVLTVKGVSWIASLPAAGDLAASGDTGVTVCPEASGTVTATVMAASRARPCGRLWTRDSGKFMGVAQRCCDGADLGGLGE